MAVIYLIVNAVLWCVPLYYLLPRAGMNPALALVGAIPAGGFVMLWVLAFRRWPREGGY